MGASVEGVKVVSQGEIGNCVSEANSCVGKTSSCVGESNLCVGKTNSWLGEINPSVIVGVLVVPILVVKSKMTLTVGDDIASQSHFVVAI